MLLITAKLHFVLVIPFEPWPLKMNSNISIPAVSFAPRSVLKACLIDDKLTRSYPTTLVEGILAFLCWFLNLPGASPCLLPRKILQARTLKATYSVTCIAASFQGHVYIRLNKHEKSKIPIPSKLIIQRI